MEASTAMNKYYYYPHFIDEKTEAQRGKLIYPRSYC